MRFFYGKRKNITVNLGMFASHLSNQKSSARRFNLGARSLFLWLVFLGRHGVIASASYRFFSFPKGSLVFVSAHGWLYLLLESSLSTLWWRTVQLDGITKAYSKMSFRFNFEMISTRTMRKIRPEWVCSACNYKGILYWVWENSNQPIIISTSKDLFVNISL